MLKIATKNKNCCPSVAHTGDAGIDLRYNGTTSFIVEWKTVYKVPTGINVEIPLGKCGVIFERSGLGLKGINILGRIIDAPYRGEICVILDRNSEWFRDLTKPDQQFAETIDDPIINPGDKIAQLVIMDCDPEFEVVPLEKLSETIRGDKGFGSSDKK